MSAPIDRHGDRRRAAAESARLQRDAAKAVYDQACVVYRNRLLECLEHENPGLFTFKALEVNA